MFFAGDGILLLVTAEQIKTFQTRV